MRAVVVAAPGGPEQLHVEEIPDPVAREGEIVVRVAAAGVNRADLLQRQGFYPPPPGASEILGLEASGTVSSVGPGVDSLASGDRVMLLVEGGGYAELVSVRAAQAVRVPASLDLIEAGGIPEVLSRRTTRCSRADTCGTARPCSFMAVAAGSARQQFNSRVSTAVECW